MKFHKYIDVKKNHKILVVGDSCKDIYVFGNCSRLSQEAPVPVFKENYVDERPGMAASVVQNLKNLGNTVFFISNNEEIIKKRLVDENHMHYIVRIDYDPDIKSVNWEGIEKISPRDYDALVISDYDKGFLTYQDAKYICTLFTQNNIPIFVDSKKEDLSCFEGSIIKINRYEKEKLKKLPENYRLIITLGNQGALFEDKIFPPFKVKVSDQYGHRDPCGAGDTFLSAFVHNFLISSGNIADSIGFANMCGAITAGNLGSYAITLSDLGDVLE